KEKRSLVGRDAALTNVLALAGGRSVVPDLMARAGVHGPDIVGDGEVQNAVDQQRRGFEGHRAVGLKRPREREILYVLRSDLMERTVTHAGIVAVIARPTVRGRMQERLLINPLRQAH